MFSSDEYLEKQKTSTAKGVGGDYEGETSDLLDKKGQPLLCISCVCVFHMLNSCPDSWENSSKKGNEKSYYTENTESDEEAQAFFTQRFQSFLQENMSRR